MLRKQGNVRLLLQWGGHFRDFQCHCHLCAHCLGFLKLLLTYQRLYQFPMVVITNLSQSQQLKQYFSRLAARSPNKYCQNCYPVAKLFLAICDPMGCSKSGFPVHHQLPEPAQTHVHRVNDAIQPSHPLSPFLFLPSIFPSLKVFSSESALRNQVAKVLELRLQHQCFQ